jgi:hypothetical protein
MRGKTKYSCTVLILKAERRRRLGRYRFENNVKMGFNKQDFGVYTELAWLLASPWRGPVNTVVDFGSQ